MSSQEIKSVGKWVSVIDRYTYMYMERKYRKFGIGKGQVPFLHILYQKDGVSQDYLAKQLMMDKTSTARAVKKLEDLGYVTRNPSEQDRRVNLVHLTKKARNINEDVFSTMYEWTEILTEDFSEEEQELLLEMLERLAINAVNHIKTKD